MLRFMSYSTVLGKYVNKCLCWSEITSWITGDAASAPAVSAPTTGVTVTTGPNLGLVKNSSFESLQAMVEQASKPDDGERAYYKPNSRVGRSRGCNESFRAAVDRSYDPMTITNIMDPRKLSNLWPWFFELLPLDCMAQYVMSVCSTMFVSSYICVMYMRRQFSSQLVTRLELYTNSYTVSLRITTYYSWISELSPKLI